jgi:chromosome segregation ATPase
LSQQHYNQIASGKETAKFQATSVNPPADADDPEAWKKSVQEARAAYEAERLRRMVLELDADHGAHQWKHYTSSVLETLDTKLKQDKTRLREQVDEINLQRQQHQQEAGRTISILQNQFHDLIQKKYSLALATRELEAEVEVMKKGLPTEPDLKPEAES